MYQKADSASSDLFPRCLCSFLPGPVRTQFHFQSFYFITEPPPAQGRNGGTVFFETKRDSPFLSHFRSAVHQGQPLMYRLCTKKTGPPVSPAAVFCYDRAIKSGRRER